MKDSSAEIISPSSAFTASPELKCSVIVPTYNRSNLLEKSIKSIIFQDFPPYLYEILVVDNGSTDGTRNVVEFFSENHKEHTIRYIFEPAPGLHSGRHKGAFESEAEILIYADDDIQAAPNWLSAIVQAFEDPSVHIVGGPCLPEYEVDPPKWIEQFWTRENGRMSCGPLSLIQFGGEKREIDPVFIWGLNYSIQKKTLFELGGFNPDSFPKHLLHLRGDGETGLSSKIKHKGYNAVYIPEAVVYHIIHKNRLTVSYFIERFYRQGISDSYTKIREFKGTHGYKVPRCQKIDSKLFTVPEGNHDERLIRQKIQNAYVAGFQFHQKAVRNNKLLSDWVLRENYFKSNIPQDLYKISVDQKNERVPSACYSELYLIGENMIGSSKKNIELKLDMNSLRREKTNATKLYNNEFYKDHQVDTLVSAKVIVPFLLDVFPANSVVDVGCGTGTWLSVFRDCGVETIRGYDVNDLPRKGYQVDKKYIVSKSDFSSKGFSIDFKADMAICLEVGEHLEERATDRLIKQLIKAAPVVIFSAAIPGQTGVHHINEQPPWYWREKFQNYGYVEIDFLRPILWADTRISWWYRQNITSFVNPNYIRNNQLAKKLSTRFRKLNDPENLTPVSEWILKKHFMPIKNTMGTTDIGLKEYRINNKNGKVKHNLTLTAPSDLLIAGINNPRIIFFVVGHPKSGTTWLSKILNNHPEISCKYEGHFFNRNDGYNTLSNSINLSPHLKQWAMRPFNNWSLEIEKEILYINKLIIQFYFQMEAHQTGLQVIGDKSPSYQLNEMATLFPDAKVIHIIRDGRDVAVSMAFHRSKETERYITKRMMKELDNHIKIINSGESIKELPNQFIANIAKTWTEEVSICREHGKRYFNENYMEIKYEDLHLSPITVIRELFRLLEVNSGNDVIEHCIKKAEFKVMSGGREKGQLNNKSFFRKGIIGDWKNVLNDKNLACFYSTAGFLLKRLKYF
jgi:glycosyltransferase involved in cell wall biosynthesis